MPQVLFVHTSPPASDVRKLSQGSYPRQMARALKECIKGKCVRVVDRDIAAKPPAMVDHSFVVAANTLEALRTPEQHTRLRESDELVNEVLKSDVIVIGCPMIDRQIPLPLKAWMDNLVRPGKTFTRPEHPHHDLTYGLLHGKLVVLLESDSADNRSTKQLDQLSDVLLRSTLAKLGVRDFECITVKETKSAAFESCDPISWIKCQSSLGDLANKLKKRWQC